MQINKVKLINWIFYIVICINLFQEFLYSLNSKFSFLFYFTDALLILIIVIGISVKNAQQVNKTQIIWWILFLAYSIFTILWSSKNLYYILFRTRYFLQGIIILFIVQKFVSKENYKKIIKLMCFMQVINLLLSIYQNRILGLFPDFCNGLFGYIGYGSGTVGIYSLALSILSTIYYLDGKWKLFQSLFIIGISAAFCAFAEVKVYYVVFTLSILIIFILRLTSNENYMRGILVIVTIIVIFYLAYLILEVVLPNNLATLFNFNDYVQYDSRSNYAGRLNTIPFILNNQFFNSKFLATFGSGLGTSSSLYIYELGKSFSEVGFLGLCFLVIAIICPFIQYLFDKNKTSEKLFVAVFSVDLLISIVVWNIPFVRVAVILVFFFIGIANTRWTK